MSSLMRLVVFALGLLVAFGAALGIGRAVGPVDLGEPEGHDAGHDAVGPPGGLSASQDGYAMQVLTPTRSSGTRSVSFTILGPDGGALTDYEVQHDKLLHLVAVNRDLTGFQHVHPEQGPDGSWSAELDLVGGAWRLFADFVPAGGENLVLGGDLTVTGRLAMPRPQPLRTTSEVDGYTVTLDGDLVAGDHSILTLDVSRDDVPVTDLEPYLGAYGHLVALRESDLAYLHVHPEDGPAGPAIEFGAEVPSAGRYRLFLDFKHGGVVRTAAFVVEASLLEASAGEGAHDDDH